MARTLTVSITSDALRAQADRLDGVANRALLAVAAVDAVNATTVRAEQSIREAQIANINLSDAYVRSKTDVRLAVSDPRAEVTVRGDLTILGRYPLDHITVRSKSGKSKGDPSRGVPAGSKAAGVRVRVKRNAATEQPKWFTMRLRRGAASGQDVGVFVRSGPSTLKHIYGPSPYSLFRFQAGQQLEAIADDLTRTTAAALDARLNEVL